MDIGGNNKMFLLLSNNGKAAVIEYRYRLREDISREDLIKATRDAVDAFPYYSLKPVIDQKGRLDMVPNDNDLPVFIKDGTIRSLGSSDTNGYLFRVLYDGDEIAVEASHGIGDGRGIMAFSQTLVYYYLLHTGKDVDPEGMLYTKEDLKDNTITDNLLDRISEVTPADEETVPHEEYQPFGPTEEKALLNTPDTQRLVISWDSGKLIGKIKSLGATPLVFFHDLIAHTIYEYYDTGDKTVIGDVPVDLREKLGSRAQSNFTVNISIPIERGFFDLPDSERYQKLSDMLKERTSLEYLAYKMKEFGAFSAMLDQLPLNDDSFMKQMGDGEQGAPAPQRSYLLSNIGLMRLPRSVMEYVRDFDIYFTNLEPTPVYTMLTYGGRGMLIIGQNYADTGFARTLYEKLLKMDVDVSFRDDGVFCMDDVSLGRFDTV